MLGPSKAPIMLANNIYDIALGIKFLETLSAAAKRYCAVKACPIPIKKLQKQYRINKLFNIEKEAIKAEEEVISVALIKPNFLPLILIKYEAKILPREVPIIIKAIGKVAKDLTSIIDDPIIPLRKTVIGAAVKEKICENNRMDKLRLNTNGLYIKVVRSIIK